MRFSRVTRPRAIRSRLLGAALPAALVLGLAGCGQGSTSLQGLEPAAAIAKAAENATSDSAAYAFEMVGEGIAVKGTASFRGGDDPAASMRFDEFDVSGATFGDGVEFRLVDDVAYLRFEGNSPLPGVKSGQWVMLPVEDMESQGSAVMGLDPTFADPGQQLEAMLGTEKVQTVGVETLDGVRTTHYRAEIDAMGGGTVTEQKSSSHSNELSRMLENQLEADLKDSLGLSEPMQVDVWIDDDYRARKLMVGLPFVDNLTMTLKVTELGSDVQVQAPSGATELDMQRLFGDLFGNLFGGMLGEDMGELFSDSLGEGLAGSLGDGSDFAELSEQFEKEFEKQFEKQLREQLGSGSLGEFFDAETLDELVQAS